MDGSSLGAPVRKQHVYLEIAAVKLVEYSAVCKSGGNFLYLRLYGLARRVTFLHELHHQLCV